MKDILMIAHFVDDFSSKGNNRINYLANRIYGEGNLELLTSSFSHINKVQRSVTVYNNNNNNYKISYLFEPGYKKNVSLKRIFSHKIFSINLKKYLNKRKTPDVIYCTVPSVDAAYIIVKYAKKNNIKLILDVQDLWPDAFKMIIKTPLVVDVIFIMMKFKNKYIYENADSIITVSSTYLEKIKKKNNVNKIKSVYLGTDLSNLSLEVDFIKHRLNGTIVNFVYVGTLGESYDLILVFEALNLLYDSGFRNLTFNIYGSGPLMDKFKNHSKKIPVPIIFKGRIPYKEMMQEISKMDIAVNPIKKGSAGSIINKVGDYAAAGLPVLNTQDNKEYIELIDEYYAGLSSNPDDIESLVENMKFMINNPEERITMGKNNRILSEEKFDRANTYKYILDEILNI